MQRNRANNTLSVEIVYNAAQMFDGLHLKRPATGEWLCNYISILHRFRDINTYLPKNKTSRDLDHTHLTDITQDWYISGQFVHKIWWFYFQPFQKNLRGCKNLKWIMWPEPCFFQGRLVVRRLTLDITYNRTKFDESSFSRSRDISV